MPSDLSASLSRAVDRLARRQHGVVSRAQLAQLGASRGWVRAARGRGELVPLQPQVFRLGGLPETWQGRAFAACLQCGAGAVLSHTTAARLRGLEVGLPEARFEVTIPGARRVREVSGIRLHRVSRLGSADRARFEGLPVTTVGRTVADLAAYLDGERLEALVDEVLFRQLVPLGVLLATVERTAGRGVKGSARLRRAVAPWRHGPMESPAEAAVLRVLCCWRLPAPVVQHEVRAADGSLLARVDFAWPGCRLALEVDGFRAHDGPRRFVADRKRWNRLRAAGWEVVPVTAAELRESPEALRSFLRLRLSDADGARGEARRLE